MAALDWIYYFARGKGANTIALLCVGFLFCLAGFHLRSLAIGPVTLLDARLWYDAADATRLLHTLRELDQLDLYISTLLSWDMLFPLCYGSLLVIFISKLFDRAKVGGLIHLLRSVRDRLWRLVRTVPPTATYRPSARLADQIIAVFVALPLCAMSADITENLLIVLFANAPNGGLPFWFWLAPLATLCKWLALLASISALGFGLYLALYNYRAIIVSIFVQTRFSLIIVVAAGLAFLLNDQAQDMLASLQWGDAYFLWFYIAVFWWAIQSWAWARYALERAFSRDGERGRTNTEKLLIDVVPRSYAFAAYLLAVMACAAALAPRWITALLALQGIVVLRILISRRAMMRGSSRLQRLHHMATQPLLTLGRMRIDPLKALTLTVMLLSSIGAIFFPVTFGGTLGAGAVVFLALGCLVPAGTWLAIRTRQTNLPLLSILLVAALLFSPFNDNHQVRGLRADIAPESSAVQSVDQAFAAFDEQALCNSAQEKPIVLVATAGGGQRAAYWTAAVLAELQARSPRAHRNIFAISGVSGGSVGAAFYNAALASDPVCSDSPTPSRCLAKRLLPVFGRDYLAPVSAALFYSDLMQSMWPFAWFPDRAAALEESFESGFDKAYTASQCGLDQPLRSFSIDGRCARKAGWGPILLLNGTHEESGRRIIGSALEISPQVFADADNFETMQRDRQLPLSTAAHNSARFTYLSPAGTIVTAPGATTDPKPELRGHVLDGGYFENYGATTLRELLEWVQWKRGKSSPIAVLAIDNDIDLPRGHMADVVPAELKQMGAVVDSGVDTKNRVRFANEVRAPLKGLLATRSARGLLAFKQLRHQVCGAAPNWIESGTGSGGNPTSCVESPYPGADRFLHFHIEKRPHVGNPMSLLNFKRAPNPPLGWVLSRASRQNMDEQIGKARLWNGEVNPNYLALQSAVDLLTGLQPCPQ